MARHPAAAAVLGVLIAVALSADGSHGQQVSQNAEGAQRSTPLSEERTLHLVEDLAVSDSQLTTVTYVGFANFITTIGSTVVVFMPRTGGGSHVAGPTRTGKSIVKSKAPVFVPGGRVTKIKTTTPVEQTAAVFLPRASSISKKVSPVSALAITADSPAGVRAPSNDRSTATTREFNTNELYPTGLVTSIGGTLVQSDITTVFTTLFYGTYIKGRYAKVARSASSIYHGGDLSTTASHPIVSILSTPVGSAALRQKTLIREPHVASASVSNSLARAVGSDPTAQIIVSDETAKVLKQSRALEGSVVPAATPALFSSHADAEEVKSVLKTYYTTYTYFTTLVKDGTSAVRSSLSTVSSVATERLPAGAVTAQTTKLVSSTATVDGKEIVSTEQVTKLLLLSPKLTTQSTTAPRVVTKTFFTTYTYFTTSLAGASSVIKSRLVVSSNVVTSKATETSQVTASPAAVKSELSSVAGQPSSTPPKAQLVARSPLALVDAATRAVDVPAQAAAVHQTGLISSRTSSVVNAGVTTVHSTGYFGTVVNGRYLQIVQSTTSVLQPTASSSAEPVIKPIPSSVAPQPKPTALPRLAPAPVSTSSAAGPSSRRSNRLFNLPEAIRSSPRSSTAPLPKSRTTVLTSAANAVSSSFALRSSSIAKSSRSLPSSSRAFRQFRRSGGERKADGLLALLAKKHGLKVGAPNSSAPQSLNPSQIGARPPVSSAALQTAKLRLTSTPDVVTTLVSVKPHITSEPNRSSEPSIAVKPTQTRRRVIVKTRRSFRGALGRRQKRPGLRALIKTDNVEREETQATAVPSFKFRATEANEINDEQPIDPTEDPEPLKVPDPTTTETPVAARSQRVLAFSRGGRRIGGTRNALPLKRRTGSGRPRGLASRFLAASAFSQEPVETTTTEAITTTTTSTTPKAVPTTTEPPTEAPASPFARARNRSRPRGRRLPFTRRTRFRRDISKVPQEELDVHRRGKRQAFGARTRGRASSLRDIISKEVSAEADIAEADPPRSRRRSQRPLRRRTQSESLPRARTVSPTPSDSDKKQQFTLTPNRSRSRSSSSSSGRSTSSSTRRAIPGSRSRRPVRPEAPEPSSSASSSSTTTSSGRSKVSLRQRLQQARFGNSGSSSSSSKSSGTSSSRRTPSRRQPSVSLPSRTPSRSSSSSRGSSRTSSIRRPTNRRPSPFAGRGGNRGSSSSLFEPEIDPTPVLPEGHIIVISDEPITTSIPLVNNGRTTYKEVLSATTVTATLKPDQYSVTDIAGELRTHVGVSTAVGAGGLAEVSTLYLAPTEINTGVYKTTRIRGRQSSSVSSYIQPAFTVAPEVSTVPASPLQQQPQGQNNNALMLLLQQLLGGQQPGQPNFGSPPINVPTPKPQPVFRTFSHTTTYVTTLTESALTTVPIFFQGRRTHTVIVNKDVNVITATEVLTSSEEIPGQTVPPAAGLGGGFGNTGFGLTPQQLLLQQLFAQPAQQPLFQQPQLPLIRPTRQPVFAAPSQPPQLEELLRQATAAPAAGPSSSVVTVYISGSRPGEFFTQLSTVYEDGPQRGRVRRHAAGPQTALPSATAWSPPLSEARDPPPDDLLQFYVMSAMNEVEAAPVTARATQTLESAWARPSLTVPHVLDTAPSATYVLVRATEANRGTVA